MKLGVFGGTGGVGRQVVQQALAQGDEVFVLARNPAKLNDIRNEKLTTIDGNTLVASDIDKVMRWVDAVVVSLGTTGDNPTDVVSRGTQLIINSMKKHDVKRLIAVTSLGVGDSKDQVPFFFKVLMKTVMKGIMADKEVQETRIRQSGLDWTIVRPGGLSNEARTEDYKVSTGRKLQAGMVSRADVAHFILQELAEGTHRGEAVGITGA